MPRARPSTSPCCGCAGCSGLPVSTGTFQSARVEQSQIDADQSAQAIAGTINIILKDAPRRSQRDLRLGLGSGLGRPQGSLNFTLGEAKGALSASLPLSAFEWRRENTNTLERLGSSADGGLPAATHVQVLIAPASLMGSDWV
jgi:hypothetical protein